MKISQEAREAAQVLATYLSIRGLKDGQIERSMQSLINSTLERAAGVAEERARVLCGFEGVSAAVYVRASELNAAATAIRQLMESE